MHAAAVAAIVAVVPGVSAAQNRTPRVGIGPFAGERSALVRSLVAAAFGTHAGELELTSASDYNAAADRLGFTGRTDEESVMAVARELRLDQVIVGNLERRPRGYHLQVRVLRGRDARSVGSSSWDFERTDEINGLSGEIWDQLRTSFRVEDARSSGGATDTETPFARNSSTSSSSATSSSSSSSEGNSPTDTSAAPSAAPIALTPGLGWMNLSVGGGVAGRSWRIPILGELTARGYENSGYGELQAGISVLFRLLNNRMGIGGEARISFPVGLVSQGRTPEPVREITLDTSALEAIFGVVAVVRPSQGGRLQLGVGFAYHSFDIDTSRLAPEMRLTPMSYLGLRVAGEGTLPFYADSQWEIGAIFGGEFRVTGIGAESKEAFGVNADTTFGYGAWFGLAARLDRVTPGLGLRATAEFLRYRTTFAGPARIGTGSDSVDDYNRFLFGVTYAIGTERLSRRPASSLSNFEGGAGAAPTETGDGSSGSPTPTPTADPFAPR